MYHKKPAFVLCLFVFVCLTNFVFASQIQQMRTPILFEKNIGQEPPSVKYFARGSAYKTLLSAHQAQFIFRNEDGSQSELGISLEGSQSNPIVKHVGSTKSRINYYSGNDPSNWMTDVPAFESSIYKSIYAGIDWLFYENEGLIEFDFVVAPGSDPSQILLNLKGADQISIDDSGDLKISIGTNQFTMMAAVAYQCDSYEWQECKGRSEIASQYKIAADHKIEFELGSYDRNKTLIIDPKIGFGTLLGGNTFDIAIDVAVDTKGNFYVVGYTEANTRIPGNGDGFVHKFSPAGALLWTTFLVGNSGESAASIAVNPAGICFVGGSTSSRDFPIAGAFQPNYGGSADGFIVKLAANGTIMRSSFIGGSGRDAVTGVQLGKGSKMTNGLYLFGNTDSRNFPRKKATQNQFGGGFQDGFLTIVHSIQFQTVFSSYVGRNGNDQITSVALNTQRGDLYVMALSPDNNEGPYILQLKPKSAPAIVSQPGILEDDFNPFKIIFGHAIFTQDPQVFKFGFAMWLANTAALIPENSNVINAAPSVGLITICPRPAPNTPCFENASLTLFDQDLNRQSTTTFGGTGPGAFIITDVVTSPNGTLYMTGDTLIKNLPLVNPIQTQHKGGWEVFVFSLAPGTFQPTFYSYLGGPLTDLASGVAVDNAGNIFVVGSTLTKNFPTTPGAPKRRVTGTTDGYVIKITP